MESTSVHLLLEDTDDVTRHIYFQGVASVCFEYLKTAAKRQSGVAHSSLTADTFTPLQITVNEI